MNTLKAVSRSLVAAVFASTALAGCASVDESFLHAGNDYSVVDDMEGA